MVEMNLDTRQMQRLEESIRALPGKSEKVINEVLHSKGVNFVKEEITNLLPVSKKSKKHAKSSNPFTKNKFNLGFLVKAKGGAAKNKGSFGYLVFPNEGRGPHNPREQRFMEKGLEKATPKTINEVQTKLIEKIREEI